MSTKRYPSDLTHKEWEVLEALFPKLRNPGRPRKYPLREIFNRIFHVLRNGCSWRMMPQDLLHWKTVYHYFKLWREDGTWERINRELLKRTRRRSRWKGTFPSCVGSWGQALDSGANFCLVEFCKEACEGLRIPAPDNGSLIYLAMTRLMLKAH